MNRLFFIACLFIFSNQAFAQTNCEDINLEELVEYCVDNGAMIAGLGTAFLRQNVTNTLATTASPKGVAS